MTERPIIFSAPMVQTILAGRKDRKKLYVRRGEDHNAPEHLARRLANGLEEATDGECWLWTRARNNYGYGTLTVGGRAKYAHILAYQLSRGPVPAGLHVMHSCDNPACINPDHLSVGTRSDNMRDCYQKGRAHMPPTKLTAELAAAIRRELSAGAKQAAVAARYGVAQQTISRINTGEAWS